MSDTFVLCPKCGEELEQCAEPFINEYYCSNCDEPIPCDKVWVVTTEYFSEEDAKIQQKIAEDEINQKEQEEVEDE